MGGGDGWGGGCGEGKMKTTVLEQQLEKERKLKNKTTLNSFAM